MSSSAWDFILTVLAVVFIIEGLPYFCFPNKMKELMDWVSKMEENHLRLIGLISLTIGVLLYLIRVRHNFLW